MQPATNPLLPPRLMDLKRAIEFIGDEDGVAAMMPLLLSSLRDDVPEILRLLQSGDVKAANKLLHPLKGFVPVFCIDQVIDQVTAVEVFSKTAPAADVLPKFEQLLPLLERLRREVEGAVPPAWSETSPPSAQ